MANIKTALIIVHYKNVSDTLECLTSVFKAKIPKNVEFTVYLVDNSQSKELEEKVRKDFSKVKLTTTPQNLGFAEGNNVGLRLALEDKQDILILLNNDTTIASNFFKRVISSPITKPEVGIVGGLIYFAKGFEFKNKYKKEELGKVVWYGGGQIDWDNVLASHVDVDEVDRGQYKKTTETDFITGALLITRRDVLEKVGLLNKKYFLYLEDVDLNIRVKKAGFKLIFDPNIKIWHKVAQGSAIGSSQNDYFITRNRLLFGIRYAKLKTKLALLREAIKKLFIGTPAQKTAIKDFFIGNFGKGSWIK